MDTLKQAENGQEQTFILRLTPNQRLFESQKKTVAEATVLGNETIREANSFVSYASLAELKSGWSEFRDIFSLVGTNWNSENY